MQMPGPLRLSVSERDGSSIRTGTIALYRQSKLTLSQNSGNYTRSGLLPLSNPTRTPLLECLCKHFGWAAWTTAMKSWRGRAEQSGNLGNPHAEKMLQHRAQPFHL
jgi:hypothetical protein